MTTVAAKLSIGGGLKAIQRLLVCLIMSKTARTTESIRYRLQPEGLQMTQSQATRSIIDTHRHIFGPKLKQKFVENIGFDDTKP